MTTRKMLGKRNETNNKEKASAKALAIGIKNERGGN